DERNRAEPRLTVDPARPGEDQEPEENTQADDRQPSPEQEPVEVLRQEGGPEPGDVVVEGHAGRRLGGRNLEVHEEQGGGAEKLDERWMLRIEPELARDPVGVAGGQVSGLVGG